MNKIDYQECFLILLRNMDYLLNEDGVDRILRSADMDFDDESLEDFIDYSADRFMELTQLA